MVDLAYSYDIIKWLLGARTVPSNDAAPAAPAASVNAGHAFAIARGPHHIKQLLYSAESVRGKQVKWTVRFIPFHTAIQ